MFSSGSSKLVTDVIKSTGDKSPLEFPTEFPIKMMGRDDESFHRAARDIIHRHAGDLADSAWRQALSKNANYVSITVTITATSQEQLDSIYRELSAHDDILVAL